MDRLINYPGVSQVSGVMLDPAYPDHVPRPPRPRSVTRYPDRSSSSRSFSYEVYPVQVSGVGTTFEADGPRPDYPGYLISSQSNNGVRPSWCSGPLVFQVSVRSIGVS